MPSTGQSLFQPPATVNLILLNHSVLRKGSPGKGRKIHILNATKIGVALDNGNYECSGVVKEDEELVRGYKLRTLRSLLDDAGIFTQALVGPINTHDLLLSRELHSSRVLRRGDLLLEDRGFLDGAEIMRLKRAPGFTSRIARRLVPDI